jgi:hypothetical protein
LSVALQCAIEWMHAAKNLEEQEEITDSLLLGLPCIFVMGLSQNKQPIRKMAFYVTKYLKDLYECMYQTFVQEGGSSEVFATGACLCLDMLANCFCSYEMHRGENYATVIVFYWQRVLMTALRDYPANKLLVESALSSIEAYHHADWADEMLAYPYKVAVILRAM